MDELRMLDLIHRRTPDAALPVARIVTCAGATPAVWTIVGVSALLACGRSRSWAPLLRSLCALAATTLARRILAEAIDRPRPPRRLWRAPWSGPSFPSRHTTLGTTAAGLAANALAGHGAGWVAVPVGGAIGASRLVLGVHWPSDVLAGWALAAVALTAARHIRASPSIEQPHQPDQMTHTAPFARRSAGSATARPALTE